MVVLAGVGTAYILSSKLLRTTSGPALSVSGAGEAGKLDPKVNYNTATGVLKEGGINGEGTHHLEVTASSSKWVYLTSSVIDLQSFVGKNVQVWGETLASKSTPWLMDVAKIQVVK